MDISIAIISHNTKDLILKCITSILKTTRNINFEIIIVDNKSEDSTVEEVKKYFPQVALIKNAQNAGFSRANNQAFQSSRGKYFFILNPDTEIVNNAIEQMYNFMETRPDIAVVGPKLIYADGRLQRSCRKFVTLPVAILDVLQISLYFPNNIFSRNYNYEDWNYDSEKEVDWVTGAALMTRREVYQKAGMLDERFFMYAEDMDYCFKARQAGHKIFFIPSGIIIHHHARGGTQYTNVRKVDYYRSLYLYIKKNLSNPKAMIFRVCIIFWAIILFTIRMVKRPFLKVDNRAAGYLQVPIKLLLLKGHYE